MDSLKLDTPTQAGQGGDTTVQPATAADAIALAAFFRDDPVPNIFHIGVLEEHGVSGGARGAFRYWIARNGSAIRAAAFVASTGMASVCGDPSGASALGRELKDKTRLRLVVGEREASDSFWGAGATLRPRLTRDHRLFVREADAPPPPATNVTAPMLRPAWEQETAEVVTLAAAMRAEELGRSVTSAEFEEFAGRVAARVSDGRIYVLSRERRIVFKADVGTRCLHGCQVEGVYVLPEERNQGVATRCVAEMTDRLLQRYPRVTLHVHEDNASAMRAYERAGYRSAHPFRLILAD